MWHGHFVEHLVCNQRKKKLTPTPHTQSSKFLWQRAGYQFIARGGSLIPVHGMNRDQCSAGSHVSRWEALVPVHATNRDRFPEMNQDRPPNGTNRDQYLSLVPICLLNRDRWLLCPGPKTLFPLVPTTHELSLKMRDSVLHRHMLSTRSLRVLNLSLHLFTWMQLQ
jgi:hypothetical protein